MYFPSIILFSHYIQIRFGGDCVASNFVTSRMQLQLTLYLQSHNNKKICYDYGVQMQMYIWRCPPLSGQNFIPKLWFMNKPLLNFDEYTESIFGYVFAFNSADSSLNELMGRITQDGCPACHFRRDTSYKTSKVKMISLSQPRLSYGMMTNLNIKGKHVVSNTRPEFLIQSN